jgi:hypothetical protein
MEKEARKPQIAFKSGGAQWSEVQIREEDVDGEISTDESVGAEALSPEEGSQEIPSEREK